jgi:GNAT superfamily N-acetyltransferase
VTDYIDDIAVDFSIYENWPDIINECAALYYEENQVSPSYLFIVKDQNIEPRSINTITSLDNISAVARMSWRSDEEKFYAFELYVEPEYRSSGVGTFLSVLTRTWAADKMGKRAIPSGPLSDDIINLLDNIKEKYELDDVL